MAFLTKAPEGIYGRDRWLLVTEDGLRPDVTIRAWRVATAHLATSYRDRPWLHWSLLTDAEREAAHTALG